MQKQAKRFLVVGSYEHPMYSQAFSKGFTFLDIETLEFDTDLFFKKKSLLDKISRKLLFGFKIQRLNRTLVERVRTERPNLVILYRAPEVTGSAVEKIKVLGSVVFTYNNDDPFSGVPSNYYWRHYLKTTRISDFNFLFRKKNLKDLSDIGVYNTSVLMPYYIDENNFPIDCEKSIDVIFIGHFENDGRDAYIKALMDEGINVEVHGDSAWENAPLYAQIKSVIFPPKRGESYNTYLNKAKIALVFLSKINNDSYTRRNFEIPATKTLMMSEYSVELSRMFTPDKEAVYFKSADELVRSCRALLANPSMINSVGEAGYMRNIAEGHNVFTRAKDIVYIFNKEFAYFRD